MTETDSGTVRVRGALAAAARTAASAARVLEVGPIGASEGAGHQYCLFTRQGTTAYHTVDSSERLGELVEAFEADAASWTTDAVAVVDHDPEPRRRPQPADGPLGVGVAAVLGRCGWVDPTAAPDAGASLEHGVKNDPGAVERRLHETGLLGRGRGDARRDRPIAPAWETARKADGEPVVVVNGNEVDPRVRGDALLLDGDDAAVLDDDTPANRLERLARQDGPR
jgi:NADH-quinone oxidoreductase subunit F